MIKFSLFIIMALLFTGCTPENNRAISRGLHDVNVQLQRDRTRQRCESGYYANNYGYYEHRKMCGYDYIPPVIPPHQMQILPGLQ